MDKRMHAFIHWALIYGREEVDGGMLLDDEVLYSQIIWKNEQLLGYLEETRNGYKLTDKAFDLIREYSDAVKT